METLFDIVNGQDSTLPAIGAPDRASLAYGGLVELAKRAIGDLNSLGIGLGDRVALALPNGPKMAAVPPPVPHELEAVFGCGPNVFAGSKTIRTPEGDHQSWRREDRPSGS